MTNNIDLSLLANRYVTLYIKDPILAGAFAKNNIDKKYFEELKPIIRKKLEDKGYVFKD